MRGSSLLSVCMILLVSMVGVLNAADNSEYYIKPYILPETSCVTPEDIFAGNRSAGGEVFSIIEQAHFEEKSRIIFRDTAAVVPLWQVRTVLTDSRYTEMPDIAGTALVLVGNPAIYIPGNIVQNVKRDILKRLLIVLMENNSQPENRIEASINRVPDVLLGAEVQNVELLDPNKSDGKVRFICTSLRNNAEEKAVVEAQVITLEPYPAAMRNMRKGDVFNMSDTVLMAQPAGTVPESMQMPKHGTYIASRSIALGELLSQLNTRIKNMIDAGDEISVLFRNGQVSMRMPGTARRSGTRGDVIPVKLKSGIIKECRIESEGEVIFEK